MAIIYSYPLNNSILPTDVILGTTTALFNGKPKNQTKSFTIANLSAYFTSTSLPPGSYVPYTGAVIDVNLGAFDLTAATIIKAGGTLNETLMADGSVANSNLTLSKYASTTYQTAAGSTIFYSDPIPSSRFANGDMLRINTVTTTTTTSAGYVTTKYFINSTPSLTGATQIAQYVGAGPALEAAIYLPMNRYYWVYNNTFIGRNFLTSTSNSDNAANSLVDSVAIPANQFYIIVLINTTLTDRAALSSFQVRKT